MPEINQSRISAASARAASAAGWPKAALRALPFTLALWVAPWGVLPCFVALAAPESIQIIRPLETSQEVYLENDDGLLIVPGGRMFMFRVEISALNPLLEVRINGRRHSSPRTTWTFIKLPQFLKRGKNRILVEARTGSGRASQEFIIELRGLPGFHPRSSKHPKPAS